MKTQSAHAFTQPTIKRYNFRWRSGPAARILAGIVVAGGLAAGQAARAQNAYTDNGGPGNFSTLITPSPAGGTSFLNGDSLTFTGATGTQVDDITAALGFNVLNFNAAVTQTFNKGTGTTITLGATSGAVNPVINLNNGTNTQTFNLNLALPNSLTFTATAATVGAAIFGGVISGAGGLTFTGTSASGAGNGNGIVLSGANTYTGATIVNAGSIVSLQNTSALGSAAAGTTVVSGGEINFQSNGGTYAESFVINGSGYNNNGRGVFRGSTAGAANAPQTIAGAVTLGSNSTVNNNNNALYISGNIDLATFTLTHAGAVTEIYSGNISSTGGGGNLIENNAAGILVLTGNNTYGTVNPTAAPTTITAGTITGTTTSLQGNITDNAVVATGGLVFDQTAPTLVGGTALASGTYGGIISGTGKVSKNNAGVVSFTNANTYSGGTLVNGGTLVLDFSGAAPPAGILNAAGALTLGGGTLSVKGNASGATAQTVGSLTLTPGNSGIAVNPNGGTSSTLTITSPTVSNPAGAAVNFNTAAGGADASTNNLGTGIIAWNPTLTNGIIGGDYTLTDATGTGFATTGAGATAGDVVRLVPSSALPAAGADPSTNYGVSVTNGNLTLTETASQTANTVTVDTSGGAGTLDLGNTALQTSSNALVVSGGKAYNIVSVANGGGGVLGTSGTAFTVNNFNGAAAVTLGALVSGGAGGLNVNGNGTTVITGNNAYTGTTALSGGTLQVGNGGTSGAIGTGALIDSGTVILNRSDTATVANAISGAGTLTQAGSGTSILTGANTYTGTTTISAGALQFGNGGTTGTPTATANIVDNGSLIFNLSSPAATPTVFAAPVSGTGSLTMNGTGVVNLTTSTNSYSGGTIINAGILGLGSTAAADENPAGLGTGPVTINTGGTLRIGTSASVATPYTVANAVNLAGGSLFTQDGVQDLTGAVNVTAASTLGGSFFDKPVFIDGLLTGGGALTLTQGAAFNTNNNFDASVVHFRNASASGNTYNGTISVTNPAGSQFSQISLDASNPLANASVNLATTNTNGNASLIFNFGVTTSTLGSLAGVGNIALNTLNGTTAPETLTVGGNGANTNYSGILSSTGSLVKTGAGSMALTGATANTYTGGTTVGAGLLVLNSAAANGTLGTGGVTVNGTANSSAASATEGVLQLAASSQINDGAPVTLNGGTLNTQGFSEGAAGAPGLGTLALTSPNGTFSFLDYGTGGATNGVSSTLAFANSTGTLGAGQLEVLNYEYGQAATGLASATDHLYLGVDNTTTPLSASQLAQITFVNPTGLTGLYTAAQLASGEIVPGAIAPTPEPGGLVPIIVGLAGTGVLVARRRRAKKDEQTPEMAEAV